MRFIPTLAHGLVDYLVGIIVIGLPFYFGLGGSSRIVLICAGALVIIYSLFTDYELGAIRFLRIRFHLALDIFFGISMLAIPSLFTLPPASVWPVYALGVLAILLSAITRIRADGTASTNNKEAH